MTDTKSQSITILHEIDTDPLVSSRAPKRAVQVPASLHCDAPHQDRDDGKAGHHQPHQSEEDRITGKLNTNKPQSRRDSAVLTRKRLFIAFSCGKRTQASRNICGSEEMLEEW